MVTFGIEKEIFNTFKSSQADPARENLIIMKLSICQLKRLFISVQNNVAPVFRTFLRDLTLIFSRMLENLIAGSLGEVN